MFCKHEWEKMSDTIIRVMPEDVLKNVTRVYGNGNGVLGIKHIVVLACKKCGKIYKSVETLGVKDV